MEKIFISILFLIFSFTSLHAQEQCEGRQTFHNIVEILPFDIEDSTKLDFTSRREVYLTDTVFLRLEEEPNIFDWVEINGPNQTYESMVVGQDLMFVLNPGDNTITFEVRDNRLNPLSFSINLYYPKNDEQYNDYQEEYSYEAPDEILTVEIPTDFIPPCPGAYDWAENTCLDTYNASSTGAANVYIKYGEGRSELRKPIIFVEGIDFDSDFVVDENLDDVVRYGQNGWENVIQGVVESKPVKLSDGTYEEGLFRNYPRLIEQLSEDGMESFDIVLVDFHDGADYIQKNGEILIEVINQINQMKSCGEENVVVGLSMGGLVARWALTTMENRGLQHDTRMYVSFDSPHLGANIPLSIQSFIWYNAYFGDEKTRQTILPRWLSLNKPAAHQMLLAHFYKEWSLGKIEPTVFKLDFRPLQPAIANITPTDQIDPAFDFTCLRESFIAEMEALGYPKLTYNVALANGSGIGETQDFNPGDCIVSARNHEDLGGWAEIAIGVFAGPLGLEAINHLLDNKIVFYDLYSLPGTQDSLLLSGGAPDGIFKYNIVKVKNTSPDNYPPYDAMPGCKRADVAGAIIPAFEEQDAFIFVNCVHDATCFMPTSHTIAYETDDYFKSLSSDSFELDEQFLLYPFDQIYIPTGVNEAHVDANINNINFMESQKNINSADQPTELPMPFSGGHEYNFGRYIKKLPSCTINQDGVMRIHNQGFTSYVYADSTMRKDLGVKNHFEVYMSTVRCDEDQAIVSIYQGGQLFIGNSGSEQKSAVLHVTPTSQLHNVQGNLEILSDGKLDVWDEGLLTVQGGSITEINPNAVLNVRNGGSMTMYQGANVLLKPDGVITVEAGGELRISSGATLTVQEGGTFVVEDGGTLIIESGANLIMEAPSTVSTDFVSGGSRMVVRGTLVADGGLVEIQGQGLLVLSSSSKIDVLGTQTLSLRGHGKSNVSFLISGYEAKIGDTQQDANLDIRDTYIVLRTDIKSHHPGQKNIRNTRIDSYYSSTLGKVILSDGTFVCTDTEWHDATLRLDDCIGFVLSTDMTTRTRPRCLEISHTHKVIVRESTFTHQPADSWPIYVPNHKDAYQAIVMSDSDFISLEECQLVGYDEVSEKFTPDHAALFAETPAIILLTDTYITSCYHGILSLQSSFVRMVSSVISRGRYGVRVSTHTEGTIPSPLGSALEMICSTIDRCYIGVEGTDILLSIDPEINSQSTDGELRPNTFSNNDSDFFIHYKDVDPSSNLQARRNSWTEVDNYSLFGNGISYQLDQTDPAPSSPACLVWVVEPPSDPNACLYAEQDFPLANVQGHVISTSDFCFDEPVCSADGTDLQQLYWQGFHSLQWAEVGCASEYYQQVYKHSFTTTSSPGIACKHQMAIAAAYLSVQYLTDADTLQPLVSIVESCTDQSEPQVPNSDQEVLFLVDASGSIQADEWASMVSMMQTTIESFDGSLLYGVAQFSHTDQQDLSIDFTTDPTALSSLSRSYSGGTDVTDAVTFADDLLSTRPNAKLVVLTDGTKENAINLLDITNQMKEQDREIIIIRYSTSPGSDAISNPYFAAASSKGGAYTGPVDHNPLDPHGPGAPRMFSTYDFGLPTGPLATEVIDHLTCDILTVHIDNDCVERQIIWQASGGGNIISTSDDGLTITTNGHGSYTAVVTCRDECTYSQQYDFPLTVDLRSSSSGSRVYKSRSVRAADGTLVHPWMREESLVQPLAHSITAFPNPTADRIFFDHDLSAHTIDIYDILGQQVLSITSFDNTSIDATSLTEGIYQVKISGSNVNTTLHFIKQ